VRLPKLQHERRSGGRRTNVHARAALQARREAHAARRAAGELLSLARLVGSPVRDFSGRRVGSVDDITVRWTDQDTHPPITGVIVRIGHGLVHVGIDAVDLHHDGVEHRTKSVIVDTPTRHPGAVALRRDVLDHQLIDVAGAQVVRAADLYIVVAGGAASLVGVDVGVRAYLRRALPGGGPRRPSPVRMIDWAELVAFVPRSVDATTGDEAPDPGAGDTLSGATPGEPAGDTLSGATPGEPADDTPSPTVGGAGAARTAAAGVVGGAVRLSVGAHELHTLSGGELTSLMEELGRNQQSGLVASARPAAAAAALSSLDPAARDALLAELDPADQRRLRALVEKESA
jgi:hypothetical protein